MGYDAVLLDNDGVITTITDRTVLARAVRDAFRDMGVEDPDDADVEDLVIGVTPDRLAAVAGRYSLDPRAFWYRRDLRSSLVQEREIYAGRKPLYDDVAALSEIPLPMGIVSSNQHRTIEAILDHYGLRNRFATFYGREMDPTSLARKKPATHYVDKAVADLKATNPLFVGDSESDLQAARRAGMDSVFVERDHTDPSAFRVEPTYVIDSLRELPKLVDENP